MNGDPSEGRLERLVRRDRVVVALCLGGLVLVSWAYLVRLAGDMGAMSMGASSMDLVSPQAWGLDTFVLMLVMWWIMMVGMMTPSAAPAILIFARAQRQQLAAENPVMRSLLFTLGYLLVWLGFSVLATPLQWGLERSGLLSPMMTSTTPALGAALLALAGLYQLTPLKQACLKHCRTPLHFLSEHWRPGHDGALRMGVSHGVYCVGCCWVLMTLLFVVGVMNLAWVAGIALFVLLEKLLPGAAWVPRVSGVLLIAACVLVLLVSR